MIRSPKPTVKTYLIGMMKVNFLKRLESSVKSFEITMGRTIAKIEALETKSATTYPACPASRRKTSWNSTSVFRMKTKISKKPCWLAASSNISLEHLELDRGRNWLKDLKKDKDQLSILLVMPLKTSPLRRTPNLQNSRSSLQRKVANTDR